MSLVCRERKRNRRTYRFEILSFRVPAFGVPCRMRNILKYFTRQQPGAWTCLSTISIAGVTVPSGARLLAGAPIDGVDVVQLLEQEYANQQSSNS